MLSLQREWFRQFVDRKLPKGRLLRGALALSGATLIAQVLGVLMSPIYTRLYRPEDYGIFSLYSNTLSIFLTVGAFCYEQAIPVAHEDEEAFDLLRLSVFTILLVGLASPALVWLFSQAAPLFAWGLALMGFHFATQTGDASLGWFLWLLPVGIIGGGVYNSLRIWALRRKAIGEIAGTQVVQSFSAQGVQLGFGLLYPQALGLILAGIIGTSAGLLRLLRNTVDLREFGWKQCCEAKRLWAATYKYRRMPFILGPSTLFNSLGLFLPPILIVSCYGQYDGGLFNLAQRMIGLPVALIGGSLSRVFFSEAADLARREPAALLPFFDRVMRKTIPFSLLILAIGIASPYGIPIIFGHKWQQAGAFALWISIFCATGMPVSAMSAIPTIVGHLKVLFVLETVRAVLATLSILLPFTWGWSAIQAVMCYSGTMAVMYIAYYLLYRHQVIKVSRYGLTGWGKPEATAPEV